MSYAQENGYNPVTFNDLMDLVRQGINTQFGTTHTVESFVGTNWYKYAYAFVQRMHENEIKASEIFSKLQEYIDLTNQRIQRPSVSIPGLLDSFSAAGYVVSVKAPNDADAGKLFVCVDLNNAAPDYATKKAAVAALIKDFVAAGLVSQGSEITSLVLSNGQAFDFKFNLPTRTPILIRLTASSSHNSQIVIPGDEAIRQSIFDNINSRYRLGWDFEPQRYFGLSDALWAGALILEWSSNAGSTWSGNVFTAAYTDLLTFSLADISVVIS